MKKWWLIVGVVILVVLVAGCVEKGRVELNTTTKNNIVGNIPIKKEEETPNIVNIIACEIHKAAPAWCLVESENIKIGGSVTRNSWKGSPYTLPYLYKGLLDNRSADRLRKIVRVLNVKEGLVYIGPSDVNKAEIFIGLGAGGGPFKKPTSGMLLILNESKFTYVVTNFDKLYNNYWHYNITPEQKCRVDVSAFYWAKVCMGKNGAFLGYLGDNIGNLQEMLNRAKKYSKYGFFYGKELLNIDITKKYEKTISLDGENISVIWIEGRIIPPS